MKKVITQITIELPVPEDIRISDKELEEQQERFFKNKVFEAAKMPAIIRSTVIEL